MTNLLSFNVSRDEKDRVSVITPCVDGVMLTALVEEFERGHGLTDPAGGYGGLIPEHFDYGPLDRYFLGKSETLTGGPGGIFVLGCSCGEVGCWPLACVVSVRDGEIIWQSFEQPHRPTRDYSLFGSFVFELKQYMEALRTLPQ